MRSSATSHQKASRSGCGSSDERSSRTNRQQGMRRPSLRGRRMTAIRYSAPGRINLIGEHTDYNLGFALPIALPERTVVTYVPDDSAEVVVRSDLEDGDVRIPLDTAPGDVPDWAGYVAGVIWALRAAGHRIHGGMMSITSDVEMGSGVSSSAALECAVVGALATGADIRVNRIELARLA